VNRIDRERYDLRGNVMATFHPRRFNYYNCQCGSMVRRKWRGPRNRGRAKMLQRRAAKARLTPAEIDHLAQATLSKIKSNKIEVIALDRKHWSPVMNWIEARHP